MILIIFISLFSFLSFSDDSTSVSEQPKQESVKHRSDQITKAIYDELYAQKFYPTKPTMNFKTCPGKEKGFARIIMSNLSLLHVVSKYENKRDGQYILGMMETGVSQTFYMQNTEKPSKRISPTLDDVSHHNPCQSENEVSSVVLPSLIESNIKIIKKCEGKPDQIIKKSLKIYKLNGHWNMNLLINPNDLGQKVDCTYSADPNKRKPKRKK